MRCADGSRDDIDCQETRVRERERECENRRERGIENWQRMRRARGIKDARECGECRRRVGGVSGYAFAVLCG